ncbi:MAG: HD domain-containing protein [Spirochaetaceae bacterium]|nr:HD domain-containing protein [Spirochaetaceae bacterium]
MRRAASAKIKQILALDSELNKIQDLDILLERLLFEARKVTRADAGSIYIREGDKLVILYSQNDTMQKNLPPGRKLPFSSFKVPINTYTISGYAAATGEPLNIANVYEIPKDAPYSFNDAYDKQSGYHTRSSLTVPIKTNTGLVLGVLQISNALDAKGRAIPFATDDELLVSHFATNATVALQRAQATRAILLRMIRMAELRDPKETGAHVNRVAGYAVEIYERWANKRNQDSRVIERTKDNLRMAAMLHDVGKVAISDLILKAPRRFTPEEYEIMKTHSTHGARLFIDKQSDFDDMAQDVALTHHENWDGTGYPGQVDMTADISKGNPPDAPKMKEEQIPLFGRIVALADVYDALCSARVYKEAWTEDKVLEEMKTMKGTKFDPELLDIFFEVLPNIKSITSKYPDESHA